MGLKQRIAAVTAFVIRLKPVRVVLYYGERRGPLLAAGLSYQSIFAVFAAIWVAFAIAGFVITANPDLERAFFDLLALNVPGLIDTGDGGAVDPRRLLKADILGWTGAIAAVVLLLTALRWLDAGRGAVRSMFGMPRPTTNFLLLKLKDLALAIGFGAVMLASAVLSVLSTTALGAVFDAAGIHEDSVAATVLARAAGLLIVLVIDAVLLGAFYRIVSGIRIPLRQLAWGTLLAAAVLGVLKALGSTLLGGATTNPLLVSFAAIIGLLIWFNFVCQVILIGAAWISVSATDRGIDLAVHRRFRQQQPSGTAAAL